MNKLANHFIFSSGVVLALTGLAKLWASFGTAPLLLKLDPVLGITFQHLFQLAGSVELIIGCFCLRRSKHDSALLPIAWLATSFLIYRLGLHWVGYQKPCPCLGTFTDALHVSPHFATLVLLFILAYLLAGSYGFLFWNWSRRFQARTLPAHPEGPPTP